MNPLETFGQFSSKLTTTDLMLYAGVAVVLWVLFKDKLGGVTQFVTNLLRNKSGVVPSIVSTKPVLAETKSSELFFELIASWKKTRDLAEKSGCMKAVEAVDQLFPYLSPVTCEGHKDEPTNVGK
jgi:hypothetical protein